ncbi:MAG: DUF1294 domain-containing protein [Clostridia bacterium]|nr:DUF1294 domain-containing protein [Clostridia bacterium]
MEKTLLYYLIIVNVVTFILFGIDKWKAKRHAWRIPEATLLGLAIAGGSAGALLGMLAFHHKTKHKKFTCTIPEILIVQAVLIVLYFTQR